MERNAKTLEGFRDQAQHLLECEARFWTNFIRRKGYTAWSEHCYKMKKRRGEQGLERLLVEMRKNGAEV